ncbi:MAG: DUF6503 family protein [Bacteroidota bacterium]
MKYLLLCCSFLILSSYTDINKCKNSAYLLEKSKKYHDPNESWSQLDWKFYIQEPRLQNPARYSMVSLNNESGEFELLRNREQSISTHKIDAAGNAEVVLDGRKDFSQQLQEKYRLNATRNQGYRKFYQMMYGLPMSLTDDLVAKVKAAETATFNQQEAYKIQIQLKEAMIGLYWRIFLSTENHKVIGLEIAKEENATTGERLYFDGEFNYKGIQIPRIRHWYDLETEAYSGSDIILKELE